MPDGMKFFIFQHRFFASIVICLIGFSPGETFAQGGKEPEQVIRKMDTDGDGRISEDEWFRPSQAFRRIDLDKDGFVSAEELRTFAKKRSSDQVNPGANAGDGAAESDNRKKPGLPQPGYDGGPYEIIDTHVHLGAGYRHRNFAAGASAARAKMPGRHVAMAIILPTPQIRYGQNGYSYRELRWVTGSDRFRVAGGSGILGKMLYDSKTATTTQKESFRALAQSLADDGIVAFGEIALYHFALPRMGNLFGYVPLEHPLLDVLGDVAAKSGIPIDVHFDVVPRDARLPDQLAGSGNPSYLKANLDQFKQFLLRNRDAKIVWAHVGFEATPFRTAELCAKLLRRHENLFMSIRLMKGAARPSVAMNDNGRLKSEWKHLFTTFPDRFVFGSESMYGSPISSRFDNQFVLYQKLLAQLPPDVARKIASENALSIYPLGGSN